MNTVVSILVLVLVLFAIVGLVLLGQGLSGEAGLLIFALFWLTILGGFVVALLWRNIGRRAFRWFGIGIELPGESRLVTEVGFHSTRRVRYVEVELDIDNWPDYAEQRELDVFAVFEETAAPYR